MNNIKEMLRFKYLGKLSNREIETLGIASRSAISNFTSSFKKSGINIQCKGKTKMPTVYSSHSKRDSIKTLRSRTDRMKQQEDQTIIDTGQTQRPPSHTRSDQVKYKKETGKIAVAR